MDRVNDPLTALLLRQNAAFSDVVHQGANGLPTQIMNVANEQMQCGRQDPLMEPK